MNLPNDDQERPLSKQSGTEEEDEPDLLMKVAAYRSRGDGRVPGQESNCAPQTPRTNQSSKEMRVEASAAKEKHKTQNPKACNKRSNHNKPPAPPFPTLERGVCVGVSQAPLPGAYAESGMEPSVHGEIQGGTSGQGFFLPGAHRVDGFELEAGTTNNQQGAPHQSCTSVDLDIVTEQIQVDRSACLVAEGLEFPNGTGMARAWPVSLPVAVAYMDPAAVSSQRKGIALIGLCLLVCTAASLAVLGLDFQVLPSDPIKTRHQHVKTTIEEVFGKGYFNTEPKKKALHWIVYNDPLQDLAAKQDHVSDVSSLIQRFALVAFYFQTSTQHPWDNCSPPVGKQSDLCSFRQYSAAPMEYQYATRWLTASHECKWMGVYCEGNSKQVSSFEISCNEMAGHIPPELSRLSNVRELSLRNSTLTGPLPSWIGQLTALEKLDLSENMFTGSIPSSYFLIPSLRTIRLNNNLLTGSIPLRKGLPGEKALHENKSLKLDILALDENLLTGALPLGIYSLSQLKRLHLSNNNLNGPLYYEILNLQSLQSLLLGGNQLVSGSIPPEVGFLRNLTVLHMPSTNIEGTIPDDLFALGENLVTLDLRNTRISGTISTRIGLLTNLRDVFIAETKLNGTMPEEISRLTRLMELHLDGNMDLTGSIPAKYCSNRYQEDVYGMAHLIADCLPLSSSGIPAMECPKGCCTSCCDAETKICQEMR